MIPNPTQNFKLTPLEEELMMIIWKQGPSSVREVVAQLPLERSLAYTSVSTILNILQNKEILHSKKKGRQYVYYPNYTLNHYRQITLSNITQKLFSGKINQLLEFITQRL